MKGEWIAIGILAVVLIGLAVAVDKLSEWIWNEHYTDEEDSDE